MALPLEKTAIQTDFTKYKFLLYGMPKIGKSSLSAQFPNTIFAATEAGHSFLSIYKKDILTWNDFRELAKDLTTTKHNFKMIAIDIVDNLYKMCEQFVCEKNSVAHPSDLAYGKGFNLVKDEFTRVINYLGNFGFGFIFISHAKEKEIKTKTQTWTAMGTTMNNQSEGFVCGLSDFIFYLYQNDKGERMMRTKPDKYILAGSRGLDLPNPMALDFNELLKAMKQNTKGPEAK